MAPGHPELAGVTVHEVGERMLVSGHELSEGDRGIVPRLNDEAHEEGFNRNPRSDFDEHPRALHPPSLLAHQHLVGERELPLRHLREDDVARQHLGQAGRLQGLVGVPRGEHARGVHVDKEMGPRVDLGGLGDASSLRGGATENQNENREESTVHGMKPAVMDSDGVHTRQHRDCTAGANAGFDAHEVEQLLGNDARTFDTEHPSTSETRYASSTLDTGPSHTRYMTRPSDIARRTRTGNFDTAASLVRSLTAFVAAWNAPA